MIETLPLFALSELDLYIDTLHEQSNYLNLKSRVDELLTQYRSHTINADDLSREINDLVNLL